jgi:serine/threonine protein kinase
VREAVKLGGGEGEKVAVKIVRHKQQHQHEPPTSFVGEALKRSVSGYRIPRDRRTSLVQERICSTSTPGPLLHLQPQRGGSAPAAALSSPTSSLRLGELSASLSSLPAQAPVDDSHPSLIQSLLDREIHLWRQLAPHPNIVNLIATAHTDDFTYIFMPRCEGGTLLEFLNSGGHPRLSRRTRPRARSSIGLLVGGLPKEESERKKGLPVSVVLPIFAQVVEGLYYLHTEARVTHRDIKLENILYDERDRTWKIADFGLAESMSSSSCTLLSPLKLSSRPSGSGSITPGTPLASLSRANSLSRPDSTSHHHQSNDPTTSSFDSINELLHPAGSLPYSPPEQMRSPIPIVDPSVDIWALGCVLYALLEGTLPIQDEFEPRLRMKIMKGSWDVPSGLPDEVLEVLQGCLEPDVAKRWVIGQVRESKWVAQARLAVTTSRGRAGSRAVLGTSQGSSRSGSDSSQRRKERSTSRSSAAVKHLGVDDRTRSLERGVVERQERKVRWEKARDGARELSRSASRGREKERGAGESLLRGASREAERLGAVAEPY